MKVRTARGDEGWTEDYLLLSAAEIAALKQVERRALTMPSQGAASTYELLNVHTEPNRFSPSFLQIKEGEKVDVLAHVSAPRTPPERKALIPPRPRLAPARKHAERSIRCRPCLLLPPPKNWKELSRTPPEVAQEIAADRAAHAPPNDDWSLVRNSQGESGWVLTRRLYMAIPDEVAQYAEGHRITSYFPLTDVQDGDTVKHNWLWTTSAGGDHPYDFDSYRVFTWSLRRHRYETAFIQRNVEGYFPVLARPGGLFGLRGQWRRATRAAQLLVYRDYRTFHGRPALRGSRYAAHVGRCGSRQSPTGRQPRGRQTVFLGPIENADRKVVRALALRGDRFGYFRLKKPLPHGRGSVNPAKSLRPLPSCDRRASAVQLLKRCHFSTPFSRLFGAVVDGLGGSATSYR